MTYIHSQNQKSILNRILIGLALASFGGVFLLVALYNNIVDLNHNVAAAKTQLDDIGVKNTALSNQVAAALENIQSNGIATQDGLIEDNHPQYLSTSWPIASQR